MSFWKPDQPSSVGGYAGNIAPAYSGILPTVSGGISSTIPDLAKGELGGVSALSPGYNQLLANLFAQYGPQLAKTGSDIENISRKGAANTDLGILSGAGGLAARQGETLSRELNPEFYKTRAETSNKLSELLGSINLNNANPEAERLVSQEAERSGNLATPSATGTVAN